MELIFQTIALLAYMFCGFRIICFNPSGSHNRTYACVATILIASFFGQSIHILFFKAPVTLWDAVFAVVLAFIIYRAKGNVAKFIWSTS